MIIDPYFHSLTTMTMTNKSCPHINSTAILIDEISVIIAKYSTWSGNLQSALAKLIFFVEIKLVVSLWVGAPMGHQLRLQCFRFRLVYHSAKLTILLKLDRTWLQLINRSHFLFSSCGKQLGASKEVSKKIIISIGILPIENYELKQPTSCFW